MSNLRDAIVRMALRRPYLYLLVTLVISIVLMEVLVEIAEHTFIKPALQQLELQFIAYVQQFVTAVCYTAADSRGNARYGKRVQYFLSSGKCACLLLVFIQQAKRQAVSLSSLFMRWWYFKSGTETHF